MGQERKKKLKEKKEARKSAAKKGSVTTKTQSSFSYIPEEIVLKIFTKLPWRSLSRFKCVSKQWYRWIALRSTKIVFYSPLYEYYYYYYDAVSFRLRSIGHTTRVEDVNVVIPKEARTTSDKYLCGSCNGVLFLRVYTDLFLWIPALNRSQRLAYLDDFDAWSCMTASGLCRFDDPYNHLYYKAVLAFSVRDKAKWNCFYTKVMVCSTETKCWKRVDFPTRANYKLVSMGVLLHNNLHWWAKDEPEFGEGDFSLDKIVCFDARVDKFVVIPTPQRQRGEKYFSLGALDGSLCICRCEKSNLGDTIDVLVMKKYGRKQSWKVLFKFVQDGNPVKALVPLFYTDDHKQRFLMQVERFETPAKTAIVEYEIGTSSCKDVHVLKTFEVKNAVLYSGISNTNRLYFPNKTHIASGDITDQKKVWKLVKKESPFLKFNPAFEPL